MISYNEIVDFLTSDIDAKADDAEIAQIEQQKVIVRQFLNDYQQQLTAHGLIRMHEVMNENELAIFFRNNHFSAVYKRQGYIWELVTDQGIVDADGRITWQSLSQLSGDEQFVSNKFNLIESNINQQQQIESYNDAMKQQKQQQQQSQPQGFSIAQQEAFLQKQYEQSNKEDINIKENIKNDNDKNNIDHDNDDGDNNNDNSKEDAINNAVAQRIALEEQLGLKPGELEQFEREQKEAMEQLEKQQNYNNNNNNNHRAISSNHYTNNNYNDNYNNNFNNNNGSYAYTQSYDNYNHNQYNNNNNKRRKKKRRNGNKDEDNCAIL